MLGAEEIMLRTTLTQSLMHKLTRGEYEVDEHEVAEAILARTGGRPELPFASAVLVAAQRGRLSVRRGQDGSSTGDGFS
jgi:hypothetical protein